MKDKQPERITFTVPVPLTAEEQAALAAQAKAQGVLLDSFLRRAILQVIAVDPADTFMPFAGGNPSKTHRLGRFGGELLQLANTCWNDYR